MQSPQSWLVGNWKHKPARRNRPTAKPPRWIIILFCLVFVSLPSAYVYPPSWYPQVWPRHVAKELTDDEMASRVVVRDILSMPLTKSNNPKIAFMFLTPGSLPLEKLWKNFFKHAVNICYREQYVPTYTIS